MQTTIPPGPLPPPAAHAAAPRRPPRWKRRLRARLRHGWWWLRSLVSAGFVRQWWHGLAWVPAAEQVEDAPGPAPPPVRVVPGALHIHTDYSDGGGSVPDVAAAAAEAGLQFIVLTDHETLKPLEDGWEGYHAGCLVLVGTEMRVHGGHILALGVPADFRIRRTGAHQACIAVREAGGCAYFLPDEHNRFSWAEIRRLPVAGMEVVNLHNQAMQMANIPAVMVFMARYLARGPMSALGMLLASRPHGEIALWDRLARERPIAGIASVDAHGRIRLSRRRDLCLPTYSQSFQLVQTHVLLAEGLSGTVAADREQVYAALGEGRTHLAMGPGAEGIRFWAQAGTSTAGAGESIPLAPGLELHACSPAGSNRPALFRLYRDGLRVACREGTQVRFCADRPGEYRLEVYKFRRSVGALRTGVRPVLFTNRIQVRVPGSLPA